MTRRGAATAFAAVAALFFAWGFVAANNDPLIAALRRIFALDYSSALLTQVASFVSFGIVSLPAAALVSRIGAWRAILAALGVMAAGCLLLQLGRWAPGHAVVLASVFVIAAGNTTLQIAANPLAATLGAPERSAFRLTLAQALNSLGVVCGVAFGAKAMLGEGAGLDDVSAAYLAIAALLALLAAAIAALRRPIAAAAAEMDAPVPGGIAAALRSRWALAGAGAIGLYVGAEVAIGSVMIGLLADPHRLALSLDDAGYYLASFYWGGALAGRLAGALLLRRAAPATMLAEAAAGAVLLCAIVVADPGAVAGGAALAIGVCNAIMFPTIFALTLERARAPASAVSGLLGMAVATGAVVPLLVGAVADSAGVARAFAVPLLAYAAVLAFALACRRSAAHQPA